MRKINNDSNFVSSVLWADEAIFTKNSITNFRNFYHYSLKTYYLVSNRRFQLRFFFNIRGGIFSGHLLELQELADRLNTNSYRDFLGNHLYDLLENILLNIRQQMYFQQDSAPMAYL